MDQNAFRHWESFLRDLFTLLCIFLEEIIYKRRKGGEKKITETVVPKNDLKIFGAII
jgi:hypothetical protein